MLRVLTFILIVLEKYGCLLNKEGGIITHAF